MNYYINTDSKWWLVTVISVWAGVISGIALPLLALIDNIIEWSFAAENVFYWIAVVLYAVMGIAWVTFFICYFVMRKKGDYIY